MTVKSLSFDVEARQGLLAGMGKLARAVGVTLGPTGRTVIVDQPQGAPRITKDGVSVARDLELSDAVENMGADLLREVALTIEREAGDGTTSAVVLAHSLARECCMGVASGLDAVAIRGGLDDAIEAALADLTRRARPMSAPHERLQVARVAANYDEDLALLVVAALDKAGVSGAVLVERSDGRGAELETTGGAKIEAGFLSPAFINEPGEGHCELQEPRILVVDGPVDTINQLIPLLESAHKLGFALLVVAAEFDPGVITALALNSRRGAVRVAAIKAPGFGWQRAELLEDIAAVVGAEVQSPAKGDRLERLSIDQLGRARKAIVADSHTLIMPDPGHVRADSRAGVVQHLIAAAGDRSEQDGLKKRLALLLGQGVAMLRIGGDSDAEADERADRARDALCAVQSAALEGLVPGGGVTLLRLANALDALETPNRDHRFGVNAVRTALAAPLRQMIQNAGLGAPYWAERILSMQSDSQGLDLRTGEVVDLVERGIVDPVRSLRLMLQTARSFATTALLTQATISTAKADDGRHDARLAQPEGR